jgi:uncharacterized Tic20 family protein
MMDLVVLINGIGILKNYNYAITIRKQINGSLIQLFLLILVTIKSKEGKIY